MSLWLEDLTLVPTYMLADMCDELEMKLDEGRAEVVRREEGDHD